MFVEVQVHELKPRAISVASEALTNGAPIAYNPATRKVSKATGASHYIVTNAKNFDGNNAVFEQTDAEHEAIAADGLCIRVPLELGDIVATTEVTTTSLSAGDPVIPSAGKYIKDTAQTSTSGLVYLGTYDNPWGLNMYMIECIG
jgi:hypothetical protein